jgi:hypothetical protein
MAVAPKLPRIRLRGTAALPHRTVIGAAGGVRFDFVGRAPDDVDVAAIGFPAWNAG